MQTCRDTITWSFSLHEHLFLKTFLKLRDILAISFFMSIDSRHFFLLDLDHSFLWTKCDDDDDLY